MSEWRITIRDRNDVSTVLLDEVPGWDKNVAEIKRHPDWHGIFFQHQGQNFQFHGISGRMLKQEYDTYGAQGIMFLTIEESCDGDWILTDAGKFLFTTYKYFCSDDCYVTCMIEELNEVEDLINRINQSVNLESLKSFDQTTDLDPYDKLAFDLLLPSKGVLLQNRAENDAVVETIVQGTPVDDGIGSLHNGNSEQSMIEFGFNKTVAAEIGNFYVRDAPFNNCLYDFGALFYGSGCQNPVWFDMYPSQSTLPDTNIKPLDLSSIENYAEGTPAFGIVSDVVDLDVNMHCDITPLNVTTIVTRAILCVLPKDLAGDNISHYRFLVNDAGSTEIVYHDPAFVLAPGDRIYAFIWCYHYKTEAQTLLPDPAFSMANRVGDYFRMKTLTHTPSSISKVFMIYETISRVAESITNNALKCYSEYFGRTDGQPYTTPADGCGSLAAVTNGMRIRKAENRIPDAPNLFSLSIQDLWNGLNPIHNIGMGVEPDTRRPGFNCLRVEPWTFFYNNDVVMECLDVQKITRSCYPKEIFSTTKFGYQKWESEQYNGLDEFLTWIYSRTTLSEVKNDLVQLSEFIASGYALEITRRLGNLTSQDWRFDANTFIICVKRPRTFHVIFDAATNSMTIEYTGDPTPWMIGSIDILGSDSNDGTRAIFAVTFNLNTVVIQFAGGATVDEESYNVTFPGLGFPDGIYVELGNISGPVNIIDPKTIYNFRIRPIFNAMRWLNTVLMSYKQFNPDAKLIFMDGQANYHAIGQMISTFCKLENQVLSEDQTLNLQVFADAEDCQPISAAERVEYTHPMSSKDYLAIKANRYGLIHFTGGSDCEDGHGWIDNIKYDRVKGEGQFLLIPKIIT